jgi:hypothetical protein
MRELIGIIYPIPMNFSDRLFDGKTKVFVKYVAHNSTQLAPKHKVIFYGSHGSKKLVGEGTIEKVEFLTPEGAITKYKEELFLTKDEIYDYVKRSPSRTPSKEMLTLVLKRLKKYQRPIQYHKPITMAGQYLSSSEYNSLIRKEEE